MFTQYSEWNDDVDLFVKFPKLDNDGQLVETRCIDIGYLQDDPNAEWKRLEEMHKAGLKHVDVFFAEGARGRLLASHCWLETERSTPHQPHYTHRDLKRPKEDEIVPLEVEMRPHGMTWEVGEQIGKGRPSYAALPRIPTK